VADAPWRCSQCGTVNEPVANACRTCGRWPSLFELEGSTLETDAPVQEDAYEARSVDVE
jgi:predicted ATP-dependent serine protease